ncbi:MAG TPA: O-antigen ligase family protein [Vicinamibacterales bacterium]|nr:O-antigen ligase family protein [Vicinamibacterales bacterium]HOQ59268.1 O-antigen ligase family protein [Vicinamibacterales bacterium]HPK71454.1 O-antigen ligase family protein [Vicinamibacterales bacterium]
MPWFVLLLVAWGALAFGAVYPWARWTLLALCVIAGAWGFLRPAPPERRRIHGAVLAALGAVALAVLLQLVPLDRGTLRRWSPATDEFLMQYDLRYAAAVRFAGRFRAAAPGDGTGATADAGSGAAAAPAPAAARAWHALSIDPPKTRVGLAMLVGFAFMLLGLARGLGGGDLRVIAPGLAALGVLMAMIGIVQRALWAGKVYGFWEPINKNVTAFGPFINRNHFAGWMLLAIPVAAACVASAAARGMAGVSPGWRNRVLWFSTPAASRAVLAGFALLAMGLALALTLSRSGIAGFLVAMVLSALHVLRRQRASAKGRVLSTCLVLVFAAAIAWVGIDAVADRFAALDWQLAGRAGAWEDAWRIHRAFPWFGIGLNTYGSATVILQQFERATHHFIEAHNDYLQLLVEGGWLVAVPALALVLVFAREVRKRFREGRDDRTGYWIRLGAVTGIVAIALQETVEFSLQMPGNAALFTVLCAIAMRRATAKRGGQRPAA